MRCSTRLMSLLVLWSLFSSAMPIAAAPHTADRDDRNIPTMGYPLHQIFRMLRHGKIKWLALGMSL